MNYIEKAIRESGLTPGEFAYKIDVPLATIHSARSRGTTSPSLRHKIIKAKIPPADLYSTSTISQFLKRARCRAGLTTSQVIKGIGVATWTYRAYESNTRLLPVKQLKKLLDFLPLSDPEKRHFRDLYLAQYDIKL